MISSVVGKLTWRNIMSKKALDEMEKFLLRDAGILPECPVCGKLECECED